MENKEEKLLEVLTSIEDRLIRQNSLKRKFLYGLLYGLGTAIGATVLFALFTSLLVHFVGEETVSNFIQMLTV